MNDGRYRPGLVAVLNGAASAVVEAVTDGPALTSAVIPVLSVDTLLLSCFITGLRGLTAGLAAPPPVFVLSPDDNK